MDLSILELEETPLFDCKSSDDPFEDSTDLLFLSGDPFEIPSEDPKPPLVLDPFDTIPLANTLPTHSPPPIHTTPTQILSPLQPVSPTTHPQPQQPSISPTSIPDPCSPLQENRPHNSVRLHPTKNNNPPARLVKKEPGEAKPLDKLAQRKLRNKESARRYREKQVARRRQLENYTRTLSEQNRELEILHERLLRLTCERRDDVGNGI